jgi:copper oxidase (laccase) domain-containing protein
MKRTLWRTVVLAALTASCAPGVPRPKAIEQYAADQVACVTDAGSRAEADGCRARVRAAFCAQYSDTCTPDGGTAP